MAIISAEKPDAPHAAILHFCDESIVQTDSALRRQLEDEGAFSGVEFSSRL